MSSSSSPKEKKTVPITEASSFRSKENVLSNMTTGDFCEVMGKLIDEKVAKKLETQQEYHKSKDSQLSEKLNRMQKSFDMIFLVLKAHVTGNADEAALLVTTDHNKADIASAGINIAPEDFFNHPTSSMAEELGISMHKVSKIARKLNLSSDPNCFRYIATGRKPGSKKYFDEALKKIKTYIGSLAKVRYCYARIGISAAVLVFMQEVY